MKLLHAFAGILMILFSMASAVEAYGIYGPGYNWGYRESTDFYGNYDFNKNYDSYSSQFTGSNWNSGSSYSDLQSNGFGFTTGGFLDNYNQNLNQNNDLNLNDGYSFTKGPCVTEVVKGNFHGSDNDFKLTREVCDNIEGTFYRDNSLNNNYNNNVNVNNYGFGANYGQNQYSNQDMNSNSFYNQYDLSQSQDSLQSSLSTSFGKGTRIILN